MILRHTTPSKVVREPALVTRGRPHNALSF